jgi:CubicO group peptidase (beta-lactamase class C family)
MTLVEDGRLNLDTPIRAYVTDFRLADPDAQATITLRQLLTMTAGLDNGPYYDYGRGDDALGRYVEVLAGIAQVFAPGSAFGYSNASTNVAGYVAARVTGQTWERLLSERVWKPLGLRHSALFAEDLLLHPVALGYKRAGSEIHRTPEWSLPRSLAPAGGLTCCSAGDLLALARMFLNRGESKQGVRVVSETGIETMQQSQIKLPTRLFADEWCVGPYLKRWDNCLIYGHSGTNLSGSSTLLWCPARSAAIATVTNVPEQGYPLADAIFDAVFPQVFGINKPRAVTPDSANAVQTDLRPYVGRFEAFGITQSVVIESGTLKLTSRTIVAPHTDVTGCELIPLGDGRFLPRELRLSGNRNWDMAFWGLDMAGRATHSLHGTFPLRRTG